MKKTENPDPVRYRVVLEVTLPDADPWNSADHEGFLQQIVIALENAANVHCLGVRMREAQTIGVGDEYNESGRKEDFSSLAPGVGHLFGVTYPVAAVYPEELSRVWEVIMKAEGGKPGRVNIPMAIGQVLRPDSDAQAVIARAFILRALQKYGAVPMVATKALFEKAARFAIARRPENESDFARLFAAD